MNSAKPTYMELLRRMPELLAPSFAYDSPNLPVVRAEGSYVYGPDGKKTLDFVAGMATCNLGHNHPAVIDAAEKQMKLMAHAAIGMVIHEPALRLANDLVDIMPGGINQFFYGNSGGEAIEGSLKLARYVTQRPGIIAFIGGFHGRSFGAASVTSSKAKYRRRYEPLLPSVYFASYPYPYRSEEKDEHACAQRCLDDLDRLFEHLIPPDEVAAFLLEPVQGEGGYIIPPQEWLNALREIADRYGILLIFDEVQTGFGRTGNWFAAQTFNVAPDIIAVAKGVANGFPLGITGARRELMEQWTAGAHGTTFGGSPISCAAAIAVLETFKREKVLENARRQGAKILASLKALQKETTIIGDVRGVGLMLAAEFVRPGSKEPHTEAANKVLELALQKGLMLYPCGHWGQTIRIIPPLTVSDAEVDVGMAIFREAVLEAAAD